MGLKNSWFTHWLGKLPHKEALRHGVPGVGVGIEQTDTVLPGSLQAGDIVHFQGNTKHPLSGRGLGPKAGWDRTISLCKLTLRVWPKHPGNGSLPIASHRAPSSQHFQWSWWLLFPHMWFSISCSWYPSASCLRASIPSKTYDFSSAASTWTSWLPTVLKVHCPIALAWSWAVKEWEFSRSNLAGFIFHVWVIAEVIIILWNGRPDVLAGHSTPDLLVLHKAFSHQMP